ncbi:hypothetical protein DFS34DRAFT_650515 [Phlyctochytrium arcticum]|nr:hypothetical protein DFS34DRAFT_650515 [Phlyctochytrium arcticum]
MAAITSIVKVLSVVDQGKSCVTEFAIPTCNNTIFTVEAIIWPVTGRIKIPQEDMEYFFLGTVSDGKTDKVQVYRLQKVEANTEPGTAQMTVTGVVARTTESTVDLFYRMYKKPHEQHHKITGTRTGEWGPRRSILGTGAVIILIGNSSIWGR